MSKKKTQQDRGYGLETFVFLFILIGSLIYLSSEMGVGPFFKTLLNTAYSVLIDTVLYICAISVIMGALSRLLSEFGVISLIQKLLDPIMRPIYNLPGVASMGIITTFLSDNPAILTLAKDPDVTRHFKKYQLPSLTNLGTAFGMGMIVMTFMVGLGTEFVPSVIAGLIGSVAGSILSTRLMHFLTKRYYIKAGRWEEMQEYEDVSDYEENVNVNEDEEEKGSIFSRVMDSVLEGGKFGWEICFQITPGVVTITTVIMILTFGPAELVNGNPVYTGAAYEGVGIFPQIGDFIFPLTEPLFGFKDGSNIVVPITALGAVGAAIGMIPQMVENGLAGPNEIAVFTAMGMCWSGYLSTHISMMDALGRRELIGPALISHTFAGLLAGIVAHYVFVIFF